MMWYWWEDIHYGADTCFVYSTEMGLQYTVFAPAGISLVIVRSCVLL